MFFKSPKTQWENILTKPLKKQSDFLCKVCKVNKNDNLVIREAFFNDLSFSLTKQIFRLVKNVVATDRIDISFQDIILDRLLGVSDVAHLYPEDREAENNIITGEGYHVYTASYRDLDLIIDFIKSRDDIKNLCDLGSGSGRALFYMALELSQKIQFMGLELIDERIQFTQNIANVFKLDNMKFKTSNFLETPEDFSGFDSYYLYDSVGTEDVPLLVSYFENMIQEGAKFYILFISGWDDIMLNELDSLEGLSKIDSNKSFKQEDRFVNFYKVN